MKIHELKTVNPFYNLTEAGLKRFELRINDRDFQGGDILILRHWDDELQEYSGREFRAEVTCVLEDHAGLKPGYCLLSIMKTNG